MTLLNNKYKNLSSFCCSTCYLLLAFPSENGKRKCPVWRQREEYKRHTDLLNWQRSSTVKSLSFKWEFFLLKIKKTGWECWRWWRDQKRERQWIHTKTKGEKKLTVVSLQQKTSLRQCASKNWSKKRKSEEKRQIWVRKHSSWTWIASSSWFSARQQTNRVYGQLWQNDNICKLFTHLRKYYHASNELTSSPLESRSGSMWLEMETKWKGLHEENSEQH